MSSSRAVCLVAAFLILGVSAGAGAAAAPAMLFPVPVATESGWEGPQFVQADKRGSVFLLRARELEVFPFSKQDVLGDSTPLASNPLESSEAVTRGAMGPHGDWVVRQGYDVRWFRSGKEVSVPASGWPVWSVGLLSGRPVAAVVPTPVGRPATRTGSAAPILVELVGEKWRTLVEDAEDDLGEDRTALMQRHAAHLLVDTAGDLWLAYQYRYRIERFSSSGRRLLVISADGGDVTLRPKSREGERAAEDALQAARGRLAGGKGARVSVNRAEEAIRALVEGRDGRYYFLVYAASEGKRGPHLDRYDPVRVTLERVPLAIDLVGGASLAAGRDGLYIAAFSGRKGRWRVSWQELEDAEWTVVAGAAMDGVEIPASRSGGEPDAGAERPPASELP